MVTNTLLKNKIFDKRLNNDKYDGRLYRFITLKKELQKHNIELLTQDFFLNENPDFCIYIDDIERKRFDLPISKKFLLVFEPPTIITSNHDKHLLSKKYNKIFTWNDSLVDDVKFIKFNLSFNLSHIKPPTKNKREKSLTMICENKKSYKVNELYSERLQIIKWYEQNDPLNFDLYGRGWDKFVFGRWPLTFFNRFNGIGLNIKKFDKKISVYKGPIQKKQDILEKYNFSFCYENTTGLTGYISEKIFDCFFSYTIPVYKGAKNITRFIPKEILIDANDFKDISDINNYINSLGFQELYKKRINIYEYLNSNKSKDFSAEFNAQVISNEIYKTLN